MTPRTRRVAVDAAAASDSRRESQPGKSRPRPRSSPAPPAMKIAGSSSAPCGATKLQSARLHARAMTRRADDADQQSVEHHHVDRAEAGEDAGRKGGEATRDRLLVSDRARRERLDGENRVRPHLAPLDRVQHLAAERRSARIRDRAQASASADDCAGDEDQRCGRGVGPGLRETTCGNVRLKKRATAGQASGAAGRKPGCGRGRAGDSGTQRARRPPDPRGPRTGRPRSGGTIAPAPAARHG